MTDSKIIDIHTRKTVQRVENEDEENIQRFMRRWSKTLKDGKFKSVFIIAIDEAEYCDWGFLPLDKYHQALACLILEDLRQEVKDDLIGYEDFDDD